MIKVVVVEPTSAEWKSWVKACKAERREVIAAVKAGKQFKINEDLYKGKNEKHKIHSSFFFNTVAPFFGKCVYCEENIFRAQHGDAEHFRPKAAVDWVDFERVKIGKGKTRRDHPGYYWLIYDWKNLIPACVLCNQISTKNSEGKKIGKLNRFPVEGKHATQPNQECKEKPLLINPASGHPDDDPAEHLVVDKTGVMIPKTRRGETCIDVFGLNYRDLPDARKVVFDSARNELAALLRASAVDPDGNEKKHLEEKLKDFLSGKSEHSAAGREGIRNALQNAGATHATFAAQL